MSASPNLVAASEMFLSSKRERQSRMWCSSGCAFDIKPRPSTSLSLTNHTPFTKTQHHYAYVCVSRIGIDVTCFFLPKNMCNRLCGVLPALLSIQSYHRALHVRIPQNNNSSRSMLVFRPRNSTRSLARARLLWSCNAYKYHLARRFLLQQRFPHLLETKRLTNNVCVPKNLRIRCDVLLSSKTTNAGPLCTRGLWSRNTYPVRF